MFGRTKDVGPHLPLHEPVLGQARVPGPKLRARRDGVHHILAEVQRIERTADGAASRLTASQLAEAAVTTLTQLTGEDFVPLRERLANHAHLGCSVATAEDLSDGCYSDLTEPHVDTALLYLALENKTADPLVKAVTDWMMEAGYYVRRTGREAADVIGHLRRALPELFPDRILTPAAAPASVPVGLPAQRASAVRPVRS